MLTIRYRTSEYLCHDPSCVLCSEDADYGEPLGHYRCQCCGEEDPELFMLRDDLWLRITGNRPELLLCWHCAESALGRPILSGAGGLPLGAQLVGGYGEDGRLLGTARWVLDRVSMQVKEKKPAARPKKAAKRARR